MSSFTTIPARFHPTIKALLSLQAVDRYQGALVFGSLARGDTDSFRDVDVNVIVNTDNTCGNLNHPYVEGVKLDIKFLSFKQFKKHTEEQILKRERIPWIAEAYIIFDKTGKLRTLQQAARKIKPHKATKKDYQYLNFLLINSNAKVERYLTNDPHRALFIMADELSYILKLYYQLKGRWWVSNKRLLKDLAKQDPELAAYITDFIATSQIKEKYDLWQKIVSYVARPLGGPKPLTESNCLCSTCKADLVHLETR